MKFIALCIALSIASFSFGSQPEFKMPSKEELKKSLSAIQYSVTQNDDTEPPFKNLYWNKKDPGIYVDVVSGEPLFSSLDKYDSGTGWPSFKKPLEPDHITTKTDNKLGYSRVEVRSKLANSHLGHVFDDGPKPTGKRYCMNSASLKFIPLAEMNEKGYGKYLYDFVESQKWQVALLAGGCFWGVQELFRKQKGVIYAEVGYTGGAPELASYNLVKTGKTDHAEAVRIIFDPSQTSYNDILLYFFNIHDPTTLNQQGNDVGTQYRSEIFYLNEEQKSIAKSVIARVDKSKLWVKSVVTKLSAATKFTRGEEYHQDYLKKNPAGYTCHFPRNFKF